MASEFKLEKILTLEGLRKSINESKKNLDVSEDSVRKLILDLYSYEESKRYFFGGDDIESLLDARTKIQEQKSKVKKNEEKAISNLEVEIKKYNESTTNEYTDGEEKSAFYKLPQFMPPATKGEKNTEEILDCANKIKNTIENKILINNSNIKKLEKDIAAEEEKITSIDPKDFNTITEKTNNIQELNKERQSYLLQNRDCERVRNSLEEKIERHSYIISRKESVNKKSEQISKKIGAIKSYIKENLSKQIDTEIIECQKKITQCRKHIETLRNQEKTINDITMKMDMLREIKENENMIEELENHIEFLEEQKEKLEELVHLDGAIKDFISFLNKISKQIDKENAKKGTQNQGEQDQNTQSQGEQGKGTQSQGEQDQDIQNQGEQDQDIQDQGEQDQDVQNQGEQDQEAQNKDEQGQKSLDLKDPEKIMETLTNHLKTLGEVNRSKLDEQKSKEGIYIPFKIPNEVPDAATRTALYNLYDLEIEYYTKLSNILNRYMDSEDKKFSDEIPPKYIKALQDIDSVIEKRNKELGKNFYTMEEKIKNEYNSRGVGSLEKLAEEAEQKGAIINGGEEEKNQKTKDRAQHLPIEKKEPLWKRISKKIPGIRRLFKREEVIIVENNKEQQEEEKSDKIKQAYEKWKEDYNELRKGKFFSEQFFKNLNNNIEQFKTMYEKSESADNKNYNDMYNIWKYVEKQYNNIVFGYEKLLNMPIESKEYSNYLEELKKLIHNIGATGSMNEFHYCSEELYKKIDEKSKEFQKFKDEKSKEFSRRPDNDVRNLVKE